MNSILAKVYPARQELAARGAEIQRKVDQGALPPGKANQALAEVLCGAMVLSLGPAGPACFSVWLRGPAPGDMRLAGWSEAERTLAPRTAWASERLERVLCTRRPQLFQEPAGVSRLGAEVLEEGGAPPETWRSAALLPVEKAGEALGLALAFFPRPLDAPDLEGLIRMVDQLGSLLLTGAEGRPELP